MMTATNRSLSRNLVLAGLALFGTVASFSATVSPAQAASQRYTAKLTTAVQAPTKKVVNVAFGTVCTADAECTGEGMICHQGHCLAGPGAEGGLGSTCASNNDCLSGQCASDTSGNSYCVEGCDPAANACPGSFSCLETGPGTGVCWPADGDGGGCDSSGGNGGGMMLLALGMLGLVLTRKKRR